jgi:hypothetical protein
LCFADALGNPDKAIESGPHWLVYNFGQPLIAYSNFIPANIGSRVLVSRMKNTTLFPQPPWVERMRSTGNQGRLPRACAEQGLRSAMGPTAARNEYA